MSCLGILCRKNNNMGSVPDSQGSEPSNLASAAERERRCRARNWNTTEMLCLAEAKKIEQDKDLVNAGQNRFMSASEKLKVISDYMASKGFADRTPAICKVKWQNLHGEYKAIKDYMKATDNIDYFNMTRNQKAAEKLASSFPKELYLYMDSFLTQRPSMGPAYSFDNGGMQPTLLPPSLPNALRPRNFEASSPGTSTAVAVATSARPSSNGAAGTSSNLGADDSPQGVTDEVQPVSAPGDRAPGSTGRAKRRRTTGDVAGLLKSSHENLVGSLEKQSAQRSLLFDKQYDLEKEKFLFEKQQQEQLVEERRLERQALAEDRRSIVAAFTDVAKALTMFASRRPPGT